MNLIVERAELNEALSFVSRRAKARSNISILNHILFDADGSALRLIGHDLSSCSEASIPAEIKSKGKWAIPSDQILRLVKGLPAETQITIKMSGPQASVSCRGSQYKLPVLSAEDFPAPFTVADPTSIELGHGEIKRLLGIPAVMADVESPTPAYRGVTLSVQGGKVFGFGSDGSGALRAAVDTDAKDTIPIIIPPFAIDEILRLSTRGPARLSWSNNLLSATVDGFRFVTKLLEAIAIPFDRFLEEKAATVSPFVEMSRSALQSAISRLEIVADSRRVVILEWKSKAKEIELSGVGLGSGVEKIECEGVDMKSGCFGVPISQISKILAAVSGDTVRLAPVAHNLPVRIIDPDDDDLIVVQQPCNPGSDVLARNAA